MKYLISMSWCWWSSISGFFNKCTKLLTLESISSCFPFYQCLSTSCVTFSNIFLMIICSRSRRSFWFPFIKYWFSKCNSLLLWKLSFSFKWFFPISYSLVNRPRNKSFWFGILINEMRTIIFNYFSCPWSIINQRSIWHSIPFNPKYLAWPWCNITSFHIWSDYFLNW